MIDLANGALGALNLLRETVAHLIDERDREKLLSLKIELNERILALQMKLSEILAVLSEQRAFNESLQKQVSELEAKHAEKERYELCKIGAFGDFYAYRLRLAAELRERQGELPHFVCQFCFDAGKKSVLILDRDGWWKCRLCGHEIPGEKAVGKRIK